MTLTKTTLRVLVAFSFVVMLLSVPLYLFSSSSLPPELRAYEAAQIKAGLTWHDIASIVLGLGWLTAIVGLFFIWRPARLLFFVMLILDLVLTASGGPSVSGALTRALEDVNALLSGVILALIYFTPLKDEFTARRSGLPQNFAPIDRA